MPHVHGDEELRIGEHPCCAVKPADSPVGNGEEGEQRLIDGDWRVGWQQSWNERSIPSQLFDIPAGPVTLLLHRSSLFKCATTQGPNLQSYYRSIV